MRIEPRPLPRGEAGTGRGGFRYGTVERWNGPLGAAEVPGFECEIFREEAESNRYRGILGVAEEPIVSADIIKDPRASVVNLESTQVVGGDLVKVLSWYDNEWGYAAQMVREAKRMIAR